jgi:hypothetical protein
MKTSHKLLALVLVTGIAGLASFNLANSELTARMPLEALLAVTVSLGLVRFAVSDYARRAKRLALPEAPLLRPGTRATVRVSAHVERCAA